MIGGLGPTELIVIFFIVLILFGGKRLPEIAKGLGRGIIDFKSAIREDSTVDSENMQDDTTSKAQSEKKSNEASSDNKA